MANDNLVTTLFSSWFVDKYDFSNMPEKRLWSEVIWRAYHDVLYYLDAEIRTRSSYLDAKNSQRWMQSSVEEVGSFVWCSEVVFGVDAPSARTFISDKCVCYLEPCNKADYRTPGFKIKDVPPF